jgi:transcriptional regulator with XRE-family HTH domain
MKLGNTIKYVRQTHGQSQLEAAKLLEVSNVHLSNLENNKAHPSPDFLVRASKVWGVDLHVLAWCLNGDPAKLPPGVREAAAKLTAAFKRELASKGFTIERQNDRGQEQEDSRAHSRAAHA